jgi:hypothetical protein
VSAARAGFSPLDTQLELEEGSFSQGVVREAVYLAGMMPYEQAARVLERLGRMSMSHSSIHRAVGEWGARLEAAACLERERALVGADGTRVKAGRRMGVAIDGTMIPLRKEGWKELKVGSVFAVGVEVQSCDGESMEVGCCLEPSYVTHLGSPEALGHRLWGEACRRGFDGAGQTLALGDGAPWIWNLVGLHFPYSQQLVDYYHAKEHLGLVARALHGEGTAASWRWLRHYETRLYQAGARAMAAEYEAMAKTRGDAAQLLQREAGYLRANHRRMNYAQMREQGWPIGSGVVESAGKQYKARFAASGMRWSRTGAQSLLPVRSAIMSNRFHKLWSLALNSPPT